MAVKSSTGRTGTTIDMRHCVAKIARKISPTDGRRATAATPVREHFADKNGSERHQQRDGSHVPTGG